jgi:hypothetical protein
VKINYLDTCCEQGGRRGEGLRIIIIIIIKRGRNENKRRVNPHN